MPSRCARFCAAVSISGTKSEVISVPPGASRSAARKPVSPMPAARSRMVWPGCGSIASIIQTLTGMVCARNQSARADQPAAARAQRSLLSDAMAASLGELAAQQLPRRVARQRVDDLDRLGHLEAGEAPGGVGAQVGRVGGSAQDDGGGDGLAPVRVRAAVDA